MADTLKGQPKNFARAVKDALDATREAMIKARAATGKNIEYGTWIVWDKAAGGFTHTTLKAGRPGRKIQMGYSPPNAGAMVHSHYDLRKGDLSPRQLSEVNMWESLAQGLPVYMANPYGEYFGYDPKTDTFFGLEPVWSKADFRFKATRQPHITKDVWTPEKEKEFNIRHGFPSGGKLGGQVPSLGPRGPFGPGLPTWGGDGSPRGGGLGELLGPSDVLGPGAPTGLGSAQGGFGDTGGWSPGGPPGGGGTGWGGQSPTGASGEGRIGGLDYGDLPSGATGGGSGDGGLGGSGGGGGGGGQLPSVLRRGQGESGDGGGAAPHDGNVIDLDSGSWPEGGAGFEGDDGPPGALPAPPAPPGSPPAPQPEDSDGGGDGTGNGSNGDGESDHDEDDEDDESNGASNGDGAYSPEEMPFDWRAFARAVGREVAEQRLWQELRYGPRPDTPREFREWAQHQTNLGLVDPAWWKGDGTEPLKDRLVAAFGEAAASMLASREEARRAHRFESGVFDPAEPGAALLTSALTASIKLGDGEPGGD